MPKKVDSVEAMRKSSRGGRATLTDWRRRMRTDSRCLTS
jgi:hypothetical protein